MMKVQFKKRNIYGIFVIIWMIVIFMFSNQNGNESQGTSDVITNSIISISDDYFGINISNLKDTISFFIRKLAHFSIYFLGGILIYNFINTFPIKKKYSIILSIVFGIVYAIFDELHQLFIDGRSGQIRDVLIDSCGVIISIIARNKFIDELEEEKWKN